ncbi:NUDIX hydrolase [Thalassococcus sp. CAU 1522]|uniref:NUDIX hydrolase n=1 Tax=Thalassococcus arenae TaxID=2851652 RepID=A0ABS6N614_9RHOB|nr:NUDIX hydrolase [Thalassococcus arenae]MBV2359451.1 NUDIX hydrolase [Thalassococcus arenae]
MTPRFGEPPQPGRRYRRRPGVYAVLPLRGALLLTRQSEPEPEIQLPGGGIDPGESPLTALHREVHEETGWRIAAPVLLGRFRRFTFMPEYDLWAEKVCYVYRARPVRRLGPPEEAGHTALWLPPQVAVLSLGNPGDRAFVARLMR